MGALGPKMNEMAAEVADGILVMPFNSGEHMTERTMPAIDRGLATAGRTRDDLEVIVEVIVGVGRNDEELEAARGVRNLLAFYGSTPAYKPVLDVHGWGDVQPELNRLSKQGDWATMGSLITDEMIDTIAVHGTPDQVAEEIVRRYGPYSNRVCAYFPFYQAGDDLDRRLHQRVEGRERLSAPTNRTRNPNTRAEEQHMPAKAEAEWKGDLPSGSGTFKAGDTISGGYTFKSRFEDGPGSNPEQLIAAAHAACFSMAFANNLAKAGIPAESVHTDASVQLRNIDGKPTIAKIELVTVGRVPGHRRGRVPRAGRGGEGGLPGEPCAGRGARDHAERHARDLIRAHSPAERGRSL